VNGRSMLFLIVSSLERSNFFRYVLLLRRILVYSIATTKSGHLSFVSL
jgi:hypothetical protein